MSAGTVYEKFFQKRKIRSFFQFCANFYIQRKVLPELRNPQSMYPWKFLGKNNFWNIYILSHFFRTLIQKTLSRKENFFPGLSQLQSASPETFSEKKYFSLKKFYLFICSGVWAIFLVYWQKIVRVSREHSTNTKKVGRKNSGKIAFFKWFLDIEQKNLNN